MLVKELLSSTVEEVNVEGGRTRNYFITPTGAKVYRTVLSGVLMEKENIGSEDAPLYRLRLADPTGGISFTVGRFQPSLLKEMENLPIPTFAVVIGKVRSFESRRGDEVLSLNPETITICSKEERDQWILMAAREALVRRWRLEGCDQLPVEGLGRIPVHEPRGGEEMEDLSDAVIKKALLSVNSSHFIKVMEGGRKPICASDEEEDQEGHPYEEYEGMVLEMIRDLDGGEGARWNELVSYVEEKRLSRDIIEEVISSLLDKGLLYEPVLGYLKAV